ncbi:MAG: aldehyde dehydrogenase family protein, partial [Planctomycetes bacterium]|nr:aldehyde dehydrogenase family protein [Planctomycetota bacterium]
MNATAERVAQNFIGGAWGEPRSGRYVPDIDPSNQAVIAQIPQSDSSDVNAAVAAAKAAFPAWKRMSAVKRGQILVNASRLLDERKDELIPLLTREQGKPLAEARGEVPRAVDFWSWMGHQGGALQGI